MKAKPIRRLLAAAALALCAPASWSQASLTRADGRITNAGKSLSGVQVILSNQDTHQAYGTTTDKYGTFSIPGVARGTYIVSILNAAGDNLFRKTLQLTSAPHAPIRLDIDISGTPAGASAAPPASPPPAAQGSNSPAPSGPVSCTESLILPVGTYSEGWPMGPYSPGGWAATPYSAVEEVSVVQTLAHGTAIPPMRRTAKIYRDSHGRSRREQPICSQLYEDVEEDVEEDAVPVLVSIDDPVAGYEYDLDPQNRIAYRYSLKALKDSVPAAHGNRPGPHMEVTKEPLGSQWIEGVLAVGTRETRRIIPADARDNDQPFTMVVEVWYSPEIRAVVLEKFPSPFQSAALALGGEVTRRLTNIDRAEPDISLFQPPADYKIEDATGPVTINYSNQEVPLAGNTQARPEATGKPQNKTAPAPKPVEVRENPRDGLKYVWIPPGTFMMGCSPGDSECSGDDKPAHAVTISKGFWIGQTPVTVGAFKRFTAGAGQHMPPAPNFNSGWTNENMPIVNVSWNDSHAFCQWAGGRLPTEAEWEYAARGGSTEARYGDLDEIAWYNKNSDDRTHDVAQKRANGFGLYDTLGNVLEWVNDWYDANYYQNSPSQDPSGPSSGQYRVLRGGSWLYDPRVVRVSNRGVLDPTYMYDIVIGLRCVGETNIPSTVQLNGRYMRKLKPFKIAQTVPVADGN